MARHINIPIFIPHEGCKNDCVFCNQRTITGVHNHDDSRVKAQIEAALSTVEKDAEVEIAFFGGSFTGIGIERMTKLCDTAFEYVKQGKVQSIRLSTRPDYIDDEILTILKARGVTHIELGIQSMSQDVLDACKRGHTVEDTKKACKLICDYGFILGGQMMIGLPHSTVDDEINTAKQIAAMGCKESRIYPCVVFHKTELCRMATDGQYTPLTVEEAVERSYRVYSELCNENVNVLRIGLQASESLSDESEVYAGANHPAMGELVMSRMFYEKMVDEICRYRDSFDNSLKGKTLIIECNPKDLSKVIGQKKENKVKIQKMAVDAGFSCISINSNEDITINCLNIYC